jgi:hypothetical protein
MIILRVFIFIFLDSKLEDKIFQLLCITPSFQTQKYL